MTDFFRSRFLRYFLIILVFSLVILSATFSINDSDTVYYLAHGKYILQHGFAGGCDFIYSSNTCQIAYSEWLFHLLTYLVYCFGQWNGLVILQIILVVLAFWIILENSKQSGFSIFSTALFMSVAVLVGMERFMLRADLLMLFWAGLFYYLMKRFAESAASLPLLRNFFRLIVLYSLELAWANTHGSFPLSFLIAGAFYLDEVIARRKGNFPLTVLLGCVLVSLLNPYGLKAFFWPFRVLFIDTGFYFHMEWLSPFSSQAAQGISLVMFKILLFFALSLVLLSLRKIKAREIFILLPLAYLACKYVRNIALFALFCALILPGLADELILRFGNLLSRMKKAGKTIKFFLGCLFLFTLTLTILRLDYSFCSNESYIRDYRSRRFGFGVTENVYPVGAVEFIASHDLPGRVFNDFGSGSYFTWRLFPKYQAFINGHNFSAELLGYYRKIMSGEIPYSEVFERYKINVVLLKHTSMDTPQLILRLYNDKNWVPVYFDEVAIVFLANKPENQMVIDKYGIDFSANRNFDASCLVAVKDKDNYSWSRGKRGLFFLNLGLLDKAGYEFEKAVEADPGNFAAYNNLGYVYNHLSKYDQAIAAYQEAIRLRPDFAIAQYNLEQANKEKKKQ